MDRRIFNKIAAGSLILPTLPKPEPKARRLTYITEMLVSPRPRSYMMSFSDGYQAVYNETNVIYHQWNAISMKRKVYEEFEGEERQIAYTFLETSILTVKVKWRMGEGGNIFVICERESANIVVGVKNDEASNFLKHRGWFDTITELAKTENRNLAT
ncbi:MAG: hypothetical protein ACXABY_04195 [Candidatus Thorarchaeota archaeon]|jgi:hypothetical protein